MYLKMRLKVSIYRRSFQQASNGSPTAWESRHVIIDGVRILCLHKYPLIGSAANSMTKVWGLGQLAWNMSRDCLQQFGSTSYRSPNYNSYHVWIIMLTHHCSTYYMFTRGWWEITPTIVMAKMNITEWLRYLYFIYEIVANLV